MARRSPEEILEQREAWLARKAAREAGEDVPRQPPLYPGEEPPDTSAEAQEAEAAAEPEEAQPAEESQPQKAEAAESAPEPTEAAEAPAPVGPKSPSKKRTPEEIRAQREAWMARKAAREAGQEPPPAPKPEEKPAAPAKEAEKPAAPKPKRAAAPARRRAKKDEEPEPVDPNITRREFLNYAWLASIGLFAIQTVGLSLWFAFPNFKAGEFGGEFPIGAASTVLPEVNAGPIPFTDGKFWLVNLDTESPDGEPVTGIMAIYKVCTHLGCLYEWVAMTNRFECPCHGSKFALTGDYLAGPAPRDLDRFVIKAIAPDGSVKETNPDGDPLVINGDEELVIDTGQRILGETHA